MSGSGDIYDFAAFLIGLGVGLCLQILIILGGSNGLL